jgi:hypothetical protein
VMKCQLPHLTHQTTRRMKKIVQYHQHEQSLQRRSEQAQWQRLRRRKFGLMVSRHHNASCLLVGQQREVDSQKNSRHLQRKKTKIQRMRSYKPSVGQRTWELWVLSEHSLVLSLDSNSASPCSARLTKIDDTSRAAQGGRIVPG